MYVAQRNYTQQTWLVKYTNNYLMVLIRTLEVLMSPMFVPGPVDVDSEVLAAQSQPMMPHRSQEFEELYRRTRGKAQQLFETQARVFIVA